MARVLKVSRSGYYFWRSNGNHLSTREQKRIARDEKIKAAFEASKERSGARRIQVDLADSDTKADIKTIASSMRRQNLVAKAARTTDSNHMLAVAPNLLKRDFSATAANQKWVTDITYLMTSEGWLYLAVIIDLYSRSIVGWSMGTRMTTDLVCDALKMALFRRGLPEAVILHSDRGSQYCSHAYRELAEEHNLRLSMSPSCIEKRCVKQFLNTSRLITIGQEGTVPSVRPEHHRNSISSNEVKIGWRSSLLITISYSRSHS
jgi:transposase InsO family protein